MLNHISVMLPEVTDAFSGSHINVFFDGTVGAGGHAEKILEEHPEIKRFFACDRDTEALQLAKSRLERWADKITWITGNFADIDQYAKQYDIKEIDGFFLI